MRSSPQSATTSASSCGGSGFYCASSSPPCAPCSPHISHPPPPELAFFTVDEIIRADGLLADSFLSSEGARHACYGRIQGALRIGAMECPLRTAMWATEWMLRGILPRSHRARMQRAPEPSDRQ